MRYKEAWKEIFLRHLKNGAALSVAARLTNVGMDRVLQERNRDPDFCASIDTQEKKKQVRIC